MKITAVFLTATAVALFGILFVRFESASAVDCEGTTEACGWFSNPTQLQAAAGTGAFSGNVTWDWYIAGNHTDTGAVFIEWDNGDPDDDNVTKVVLSPNFIEASASNCNGPMPTTTITGNLSPNLSINGVVALQGTVVHHTTEICTKDKNITILKP